VRECWVRQLDQKNPRHADQHEYQDFPLGSDLTRIAL
jgi:hypothetical protein